MDPTQPVPPVVPPSAVPQAAQDPTAIQNAMMMQLLNQNAQGQNASLGNQAMQQGMANMGANTPVQSGTPVGQPPISPQAYGNIFGIPSTGGM